MATVTIGTWNLENLYRPGGDGPKTEEAYEAKLATLVETITRHAPDVLAVQEVGEPRALADLVEQLGAGWHSVLSTHPDARGIRVGFLSRTPATSTTDLHDFPAHLAPVQVGDTDSGPDLIATMGRGALHASFELSGTTVELVTAHLKSKLLTYPGGRFSPTDEDQRARFGAYALYRRTAEAVTLRSYVNGLLTADSTRGVVVLGDLNDTEQAATTQILYGPEGSQFGTGGYGKPDQGDATRLWNLVWQIRQEHRYTRITNGDREVIDHLLISDALLGPLQSVDADVAAVTSIGNDPRPRADAPASDHAPVLASFDL
jgi:predicted extracellular nuclease